MTSQEVEMKQLKVTETQIVAILQVLVRGERDRDQVYPAWEAQSERLNRALQQDLSGGAPGRLSVREPG